MRDPYEVLGVREDADAAAIKSAFRKLAKKLHPDANKNDPKAAQRFAEINSAYEILGEDDKRKAFDRGEIDADGKPRFHGFEGFARNARVRAAGAWRPGRSISSSFRSGPRALAKAAGARRLRQFRGSPQQRVRRPRRPGGAGGRAPFRAGFAAEDIASPPAATSRSRSRSRLTRPPRAAPGACDLPTGKEVDVKIPGRARRGPADPPQGPGPARPAAAGDVLITIKIAPHPLFKLDGANLRLDVPITLYEAVLGGKVRVPTLDGAVDLAIPPGTSSGRTFRIQGKGMPGEGKTGDLYATVRIVLPGQGRPASSKS